MHFLEFTLKLLNVELSLADRSNNYCKMNVHTQILVLYCQRGWNKSYIETLLHVDWEQSAGTKLHSGNLHQFLISVQLEQAIDSRKAVLFIVTFKPICNFLNIYSRVQLKSVKKCNWLLVVLKVIRKMTTWLYNKLMPCLCLKYI